jgi:hypothetical protein
MTGEDDDHIVEEAALAAYPALGERLPTEWMPAAVVLLEALVDREFALTDVLRNNGRV